MIYLIPYLRSRLTQKPKVTRRQRTPMAAFVIVIPFKMARSWTRMKRVLDRPSILCMEYIECLATGIFNSMK